MRRGSIAAGIAVVIVGLVAWWLSREAPAAGDTAASASATSPSGVAAAPPSVAPRWSQPITQKGRGRLEGRVTQDGAPVPGATVTAVEAQSADALSTLPCRCDNHCGQRLLACGCAEAAGQLVELVGARQGEVQPVGRAVTDAEGRYVLDGLPEGALALWAEAPGGVAWRPGFRAGDAAPDLTLDRGRRLEGVVQAGDTSPLAGAVVTAIYAEHSRFFDTVSDAKGRFSLGPLPLGKYAVVAVSAGRLPDHQTVDEDDEEPVTLVLDEPRALAGTVEREGTKVPGVEVRLEGMHRKRTTTTDAQGAFRFERLRPGDYDLEAVTTNGAARQRSHLERLADRADVRLELGPATAVEGVVLGGGAPLADAKVVVTTLEERRGRRVVQTGPEGRFRAEGVRPGPAVVVVTHEGFLSPAPRRLEVVEGLAPLTLELEPASVLAGRVVDAQGALVPKFEVRAVRPATDGGRPGAMREGADPELEAFSPWAGSGTRASASAVDGGFALDVQPGAFELTVLADDYQPLTTAVQAPARSLELVLRAGGRISGQVLDGDGAPMAKVSLDATEDNTPRHPETQKEATTNAEGQFELKGLGVGAWRLTPRAWHGQRGVAVVPPEPQVVTVREGEVSKVTLRAARGVEVAGHVVEADGAPCKEAMVFVRRSGAAAGRPAATDSFQMVRTGEAGAFRFRGVPPGKVRLEAMTRGSRGEAAATVEAPATDVTLRMPTGTVAKGRLLGEDGQPLTHFQVDHQTLDAEDGRFSVPVEPGAHDFGFDAEGYAQLVKRVDLVRGVNELGDLRMSRGWPLEGTTADAVTGKPVVGALVDIGNLPADPQQGLSFMLSERAGAVRSDSQGRWKLPRVDARVEGLYATHPDYAPSRQAMPRGGGAVALKLVPGARVTVTLLDAAGQPVTGMTAAMLTGPGGHFVRVRQQPEGLVARGLEAGSWTLEGVAPGKTFRPVTVELAAGQAMPLTLREATDGVTVTVTPPGPERVWMSLMSGPPITTLEALKAVRSERREVLSASANQFQHVRAGPWTLVAHRLSPVEPDKPESLFLPITVGAEPLTIPLPAEGWKRAPAE